jgi:hypothetical protein
VKASENGMFLYKSNEADALIKGRVNDFYMLMLAGCFAFQVQWFAFLPLAAMTVSLPRKLAHVHYFTYHAELLPHSEQVVFHKTALFGKVRRIFVDIKNLEKVDHQHVPSQFMWAINKFDQNMVFRDMESKELFVFDRDGIWGEEALNHKLLV